jgi:hypothetical protein
MREECRLRMFENRELRIIFGLKKDEVTGEQRKLHNVKLNHLYSSQIIQAIKLGRMSWVWHGDIWLEERCTQGFGGAT